MEMKRLKPGNSCNVECKKHGEIKEDMFYVKYPKEEKWFVYCPICVQEYLINYLKPLYVTK